MKLAAIFTIIVTVILMFSLRAESKVHKLEDKFDGKVVYKTTDTRVEKAELFGDILHMHFRKGKDSPYYLGGTVTVRASEVPIAVSGPVAEVKLSDGSILELKYKTSIGKLKEVVNGMGMYTISFHNFVTDEIKDLFDVGIYPVMIRTKFDNYSRTVELDEKKVNRLMKDWVLLRETEIN